MLVPQLTALLGIGLDMLDGFSSSTCVTRGCFGLAVAAYGWCNDLVPVAHCMSFKMRSLQVRGFALSLHDPFGNCSCMQMTFL